MRQHVLRVALGGWLAVQGVRAAYWSLSDCCGSETFFGWADPALLVIFTLIGVESYRLAFERDVLTEVEFAFASASFFALGFVFFYDSYDFEFRVHFGLLFLAAGVVTLAAAVWGGRFRQVVGVVSAGVLALGGFFLVLLAIYPLGGLVFAARFSRNDGTDVAHARHLSSDAGD